MVFRYLCSRPVDGLVDSVISKKLNDAEQLSADSKQMLRQTIGDQDSFVILLSLDGPPSFIEHNENPPKDSDVKSEEVDLGWEKNRKGEWKQARVPIIKKQVAPNFELEVPAEDDMFTKYTFTERIQFKVFKSRVVFPMKDIDAVLEKSKLKDLSEELGLVPGKAMPISYATNFDVVSDESFGRIFFYGIGSVLLAKQQHVSRSEYGPFLVDLPLHDLKMRDDKFRPLGARIHFGQDQKVTAIHDYAYDTTYLPGDEGWEAAKYLARCTALIVITVREHLTWAHLLVSNAATREKTIHLNPEHPIRRLLTVFTYGATEVNVDAFSLLVPDTCMLHRATALDYSAMTTLFEMAYAESVALEPFGDKEYNPELQKLIDEGLFPYASQGKEYYEIVYSFVKKWLKNAGDAANDEEAKAFYEAMRKSTKGQKYQLPSMKKDKHAMAKLLAQILFTVTAEHELIGHVVDYTSNPSGGHVRISKKNPTMVDLQSYLYITSITASTSRTMPMLMSPFNNFFGVDGPEWERTLWNDFQKKLTRQSETVQKADEARKVEFKYFDPANFECSISV